MQFGEPGGHDGALVVAGLARFDSPGAVTQLAICASDYDRAQPSGGIPSQHAARAGRLVIGVRVHCHQGEWICHTAQPFANSDRDALLGRPSLDGALGSVGGGMRVGRVSHGSRSISAVAVDTACVGADPPAMA